MCLGEKLHGIYIFSNSKEIFIRCIRIVSHGHTAHSAVSFPRKSRPYTNRWHSIGNKYNLHWTQYCGTVSICGKCTQRYLSQRLQRCIFVLCFLTMLFMFLLISSMDKHILLWASGSMSAKISKKYTSVCSCCYSTHSRNIQFIKVVICLLNRVFLRYFRRLLSFYTRDVFHIKYK